MVDVGNSKPFCKHGHARTPENLYTSKEGLRGCKICRVSAWKSYNFKQYGMTVIDYNRMFQLQGGMCAICQIHQAELKQALAVDHNHTTGKVRKLLCRNCNALLGLAKESIETFENVIKYLREEV